MSKITITIHLSDGTTVEITVTPPFAASNGSPRFTAIRLCGSS